METSPETSQNRSRLRKFGRGVLGFGLGYLGVGAGIGGLVAATPAATVAGIAAGAGLLYASREIMRPLYNAESPVTQPESRLKRLGRGLLYTAGIGLNFIASVFVANALVPTDVPELNAGQRTGLGIIGGALFIPGTLLVNASFSQDLFDTSSENTPGNIREAEPSTPLNR